MDAKMTTQQYNYGKLPAMAPLATPYVPFQCDNPPRYEPKIGVVRGTLFPGLDLPFMNLINMNELRPTPLAELQTVAFALQELGLYMDTHRDDKEAFEVFKTFQKLYAEGRDRYEREYGPLTHMSAMEDGYSWLNDPWPWEYAVNREE